MTLVADADPVAQAASPSRLALPASLVMHGLLLLVALWLIRPTPMDTSTELNSIAVDIISMETASDSASIAQSDAVETVVAAGAVSAAPAETIEAVADTTPAEQLVSETEPIAAVTAVATEPEAVDPLVPVPETAVEPPATPKPVDPKPKQRQPPKQRATAAGAGGKSDASVQAAAGPRGGSGLIAAGGSGADSRYPGLVQARLKRALRFPPGAGNATGEARVRFLVHRDGSVSGVEVVRSAGSSALDEAARATVLRAAPFPPIPDSAGRASWSFTMPLRFRR